MSQMSTAINILDYKQGRYFNGLTQQEKIFKLQT